MNKAESVRGGRAGKRRWSVGRRCLARLGAALLVCGVMYGANAGHALAQAGQGANGIAGKWEGVLAGQLHLVLTLSSASGGAYAGELQSVEQGATLPLDAIAVQGRDVRFEVKAVGGVYQGTLNEAATVITGTWTQTNVPAQPLSFTRAAATATGPNAAAAGPKEKPIAVPLNVTVPIMPWAFPADGAMHLAYELHVTNMSPWDCTLTRIEVLSGDTGEGKLGDFSGAGLGGMIHQFAGSVLDKATIGPGRMAVVFLWVTTPKEEPFPATIRHRLSVTIGSFDLTVTTEPLTLDRKPVIVISPPLRGDNWLAANGPSNTSGHRRALIPIDGLARISQRFAIDWVRLNPDGKTYAGDPKDNRNYRAFGDEIHAVADGVVTEAKEGIPLNVPGANSRAVPINLETIGGNHVIERIAPGVYAFYAHMQPGSLRVRLGEKVRRGQVLGLVGNTGNSTEPHLHFDLCDRNSMLGSEGLPYAFPSFDVQGKGWGWKSSDKKTAPVTHRMEIPLEDEVVAFH